MPNAFAAFLREMPVSSSLIAFWRCSGESWILLVFFFLLVFHLLTKTVGFFLKRKTVCASLHSTVKIFLNLCPIWAFGFITVSSIYHD